MPKPLPARPTPAAAYTAAQEDLGILMRLLQQRLAAHARQAGGQPDWSSVGDLTGIREELVQILVRLSGCRSEGAAHQAVEAQIAQSRAARSPVEAQRAATEGTGPR